MKNIFGGSITSWMKKMFLAAGILFIILLFSINGLIQRILVANAGEHTRVTAQRLENQLELLYDKMDIFSLSIGQSEYIQNLMSEDFAGRTGVINYVEEMIAYYRILDPSIVDISLVNEEVHYSTIYSYEDLDALYEENTEKLYGWLGVKESSYVTRPDAPAMLLYGRLIMENGKRVGLLLISIDTSYLQLEGGSEMNSYYLLADENGVSYIFNGSEEISEEIWQSWQKGNAAADGDMVRSDGRWYIRSVYSEKMGCYQLSALNMDDVSRNMNSITKLIWGCVFLIVFFMVFLFWMIEKGVVQPLSRFHGIICSMRSRKQRNLKEKVNLEGCSEIQEIGEEFSGMLEDIDSLNKKIFENATDLYEMKVQKQEAELSWLRSQIDPHFLYNTLEVFRKMALMKDAPELAQMAVDMGNIFRYSTKGEAVVPLREEISIIKSYIRIQKTRFQGKIEVFYFLPEEIMNVPVPKMILQPLVENAIYHGLEPKEGKGNLFIGGRIERNDLILTIKDDGVGIDPGKKKEIEELLEAEILDTSRHVGILNTHARLRLQYGASYGIRIESVQMDGTTVTLRIPAGDRSDMGEEKNVSGTDRG